MKCWMVFLCYVVANVEQSPTRTVSAQKLPVSEHPDQMGIIWSHGKKILNVEKFVPVSFIIPYPRYDSNISSYLENLTKTLKTFREHPNFICEELKYANKTEKQFSYAWLLNSINKEHQMAQNETAALQAEVENFLNMGKKTDDFSRKRRGTGAAIAIGGLSAFGAGVGVGSQIGCMLRGIFGSCQELSKQNRNMIKKAYNDIGNIKDQVIKIQNTSEEKFFLVAAELHELKEQQRLMKETQDKNMEAIENQFAILQDNIGYLRDCIPYLYARDEILHNSNILVAILTSIQGHVRAYRSAFYTYRINLLNSIPVMFHKMLPPSLISKSQMTDLLTKLVKSQAEEGSRLSLAIPMREIMAYYESPLLIDLVATDVGIVCKLAIPMASGQTVFTTHQAHLIPMPDPNSAKAHLWEIEGDYYAVSASMQEYAILRQEDLDKCLGSPMYSICSSGFATENTKESCLAKLYFADTEGAVRSCNVKTIDLPTTEKAQNLGSGRWLITSARDNYVFQESIENHGTHELSAKMPGCRVCLIVLECNQMMQTDNINIRPDLDTCQAMESGQFELKLADPLKHLLEMLPDISQLPQFETQVEAQAQFLRDVRVELMRSPHQSIKQKDAIEQLAKPVLERLKQMNPQLSAKFDEYTPLRVSLSAGVISFFLSMMLHIAYTHFIKRRLTLTSHYPFVHTDKFRQIQTIPVVVTTKENYEYLMDNPDHPLHKNSIILPIEDEMAAATLGQTPYTGLREILQRIQRQSTRVANLKRQPASQSNEATL